MSSISDSHVSCMHTALILQPHSFKSLISIFWMISRKPLAGSFYIACTHPLGGVDLPFGVYDLRPDFLSSILRQLLTSINVRGYR